MKITILGSGSAYGVPYVGGCWGKCDPHHPRNRRLSASALVESQGTKILIDMGPDFKEQSITHNITLLDGVLYTHPHADHITGNFHLPKFMYYYTDRNLPLYATRKTRREIEKVWWFQNDPAIDVEYSGPGRPYWNEIIPGSKLTVGKIEVLPLLLHHGKMECMGYRFGSLAYCTDFKDIPETSMNALTGLEALVVECNSEIPTTMHQHLDLVLETIAKLKPKRAYLTHLDYTMDYETISQKLPQGVELCYDGLVIEA